MTRPTARRRLLSLALAVALSGPVAAQNFEAFTVSDIRVDGLQRISAGTVFTYLPVEKGDVVDRNRSTEAIRALFRTGFFSDVKLERQGEILVVTVVERPAINTIKLEGNKELKTDEVLKGLKGIGLSEGETYNPLNLDRVTQELTRQYNNRGKYSVTIEPVVTQLDRNRVDLLIRIVEGKPAKIRDINIVGNNLYPDSEIQDGWESSTSNWLSWYRKNDQYSREKLSGDLEKLSDFYLNRGFVDFNVESTQIAISPTKEDMYITANVSEGEKYKISEVKVSGDTIIPVERVEQLVVVKPGQFFSRALLELTTDSISTMLSNIGYAFAEVNPVPEINREDHTVALNFVVNPGPRVQVRRVIFKGNVSTADEVLRREMRQFENTWYSQAALDRSKIRLQRLGFFETVEVETPQVAGKKDQVDVVITVKERNAGTFVFGIGYSQLGGIITSVQLQQNNFLGTGNRFGIGLSKNDYSTSLNFSYVDPYFTDDGVSVGYNVSYSDYDQSTTSTARYSAGNAAGEATFGIPLSENTSVSFSLGIYRNKITTTDNVTPRQITDYLIETLGDRQRYPDSTIVYDDDANPVTPDVTLVIPGPNRQWVVNAWTLKAGWALDTRNSYIFPSRGTLHRLSGEIALPGSDLTYYSINYSFENYRPLGRYLILKTGLELGYGDSYGDTGNAGLPFFKNYYAGGPGSVRGFVANTLGPLDTTSYYYREPQPLGGPIKTIGTFEFYFPRLLDSPSARLSTFVDYGNVFDNNDRFSLSKFRVTAGVALQWQSPMGPITISYAMPIRKEDGDQIERLQFTFGQQY
ncbi:outer membrane protein assembly factor BamA [Arenimonas oryziterrae]|nr:outer membrane protein assembly factor BamA [Arenimonas oryziterrae]